MALHLLLLAALTLCSATLCQADATLRLGQATLTVDDRGRVTSLLPAGGADLAAEGAPPAFVVTTPEGALLPTAVSRRGNNLLVQFGDEGRLRLAVTEGKGFAWLKVAELSVKGTVERLQLFCLPVKELATVGTVMNACYDDRFATAVMGTEINVRARAASRRAGGADNKGCTHTFEPATEEPRQGKAAARFTATSERDDNAGWSHIGRTYPKPLDLTGCRAIRAWVHGDGGGQLLKIQLYDGRGGYRDDYIPIDFTGWKQVVSDKPSLDTLRYDGVARLGFYFNGLPSKKTVSCRIDQVEAVLGEGEKERVITLEDFEDPSSELWPFEGTRLYAETEKRYGIQPAGVGIIACPRAEFEQTIERFERASGLPSPRPGGVWGKRSPWIKRSYLFITRFSEADTDDVIAFAKRGLFDMILIDQGSWCASTGHYPINTRNFPRGLDSLRDTVARLKRAGFKVGIHYLGPSIYPPDPYLTPVPDPRLFKDAHADLAGDVDEMANFIPTAAAPGGFPAEDGGYYGSGAVVQIGDELVQYSERAMEAPYGFKGCTRGILGTKAAAHKGGARASHLMKSYGYFLFDMDTSIIDEVAANFARVVNTCKVDMVYWDGSERLQGEHWYYNAKLHKAFYDRFRNKDMLLQASSHNHYSWHIVSRNASADGHGDLKGYLDERTPSFAWFRSNLMPLDIGWYYVYNTDATTDMFEYVLNKSLGYGSSISLQTSPVNIREHPYIDEIVDLIAAYEDLRLGGKVPETTLSRLREMQKDYHLVRDAKSRALQRVIYEPWRDITALDGKSSAWEVEVKGGPCRVGADLQVVRAAWLQPGPAYRSDKALLLESFDSLTPYLGDPKNKLDTLVVGTGKAGWTREGVTQELRSVAEDAREGGRCAVYTATSALGDAGGWSCVGKVFDPPLDLSWHRGIGFWLRGDGKGGKFKLQLRDEKGATDYYIDNTYEGWRYHQLVRPEKDPMDYSQVRYLAFYFNALPAKSTVTCAIDDVKVLASLDRIEVAGPRLEVDGKPLAWSVTLQDGQALSYWPGRPTRLTGGAERGTTLPSPDTITLPPGRYTVRFTSTGPLTGATRARLTLQPEEKLPVE